MIRSVLAWSVLVWVLSCGTGPVSAWDSEQLEVFDLVEEIDENFYSLLNVSRDANLTVIKKAFRSLSLQLHPDKNDAEDAEVQFRRLVSVYEVLKEPNKRQHYDEVLKNGLPNWRSAVYYYRHVRKVGVLEMMIILFVIVTIGQYTVGWAVYLEKKFLAEEELKSRLKRNSKKSARKGNLPLDAFDISDVPKPSLSNTLPVQIPKLFWTVCTLMPSTVLSILDYIRQNMKRTKETEEEEDESDTDESSRASVRQPKKRKAGFVLAERGADLDATPLSAGRPAQGTAPVTTGTVPPVSGGLWTDDDLVELIRLANKKYPSGVPERWEKIADAMNRSVTEVTYMANKMKDKNYRITGGEEQVEEEDGGDEGGEEAHEQADVVRKRKTRAPKEETQDGTGSAANAWNQVQQKALESALAKHPKGPADRWEKIARCVPDKTKEECMQRYKHLVSLVNKKRSTQTNTTTAADTG